MRFEIKSIPIWPVTKILFFFNLILGFLFGLFYALFLGLILQLLTAIPSFDAGEVDFDNLPLGVLIIVLPIMFALFGAFFNTLLGIIITGLYNLIARFVGGIELNLKECPEPNVAETTINKQPSYSASTTPSGYHSDTHQSVSPVQTPPYMKPPPHPPTVSDTQKTVENDKPENNDSQRPFNVE